MRFHRTLVAGVLALGVAACGDDVEIVEPTPPPTPPPPALSASMAPASAEVEVGSSVVFAVNVSGGVAGEAASWSCSSSNTGIATASTTSAGCQATGVAAGGVTITATVSKGNETANVGSQLTVTAPAAPPPFEASIAPASQSVAVGSSVVFAVNTSGGHTAMMGDMMMEASWTCASSDPAIATAETTEAGCQATGVSGGEVTINVAATDGHDTINLVAQLTVTTDPVDPVQPFSASMAPESATVAVGSNAVFAINTSGGAADATAEWTCSSSDDAIATAETTDAGCAATGVAAGGVTINAAVTKGEDSANLASQLTVTAPDVAEPAFVLIASVSGEASSDASGLKGRVDVVINVERGDQTLESLALLVDGDVVASQTFGVAAMSPADGPAEQAVHNFTLSFNSGGYDVHGDHTDVDYTNGEHTISAELQIADSEAAVSSNVLTVVFDNDGGFVVTADLGENSALDDDGKLWYGGPDNGHVVISALPVNYSGEEMGAVVVGLTNCTAEDAEGDDHGDDDHGDAEVSVEFDCDGQNHDRQITVTAGGNEAKILNEDDLPEVNIDMAGPVAPHFVADPNKREDGWVNASVNFTGETGEGSKADGWLDYNDENAGGGIGGYTPRLRYALAPSNKKVSTAIAADPVTAVVLPPGVSGATKENALCVIASAVDMLGNESTLPKADEDCVTAAVYKAAVEDTDTDTPAGLLAGVDVDAPTIKFSPASPKADATTMRNFQVQLADVGSGIRDMDPVTAEAHVRDADESDEIDPLGLNVELPLATTTGLPDDMGYYTFVAKVADKAGNSSEEVTRTALHDTTVPVTNTIVGAYDTKTGRYSLIATVTDNLSIKEYWAEMRYAAAVSDLTIANNLVLPREGGVPVDAYNADDLTTTTLASSFTAHAFQAIQTTAGGIPNLTSIGVFARDNAGGVSAGALGDGVGGAVTITPALALTAAENGFNLTAGTIAVATDADAEAVADSVDISDRKVFQTLTAEASVKSGTVELKATATGTHFVAPIPAVTDTAGVVTTNAVAGTQGLRDNPLTRVDFYAAVDAEDGGNGRTALKYIGSVNGGTAGAEDFDDEDGNAELDSRRYIYSLEMSAADFLAIVGGDDDYGADGTTEGTVEDGEGAIVAIAVGDNENVGFSSEAVELVVEDK